MATPAQLQSQGMAFVLLPHRYLHASWRDGLLAEPVWRLLAGCPRTEGRLAAFVGERLGLPAVSAANFEAPQARLCLLPADALLKIARLVGLALNAGVIARAIESAEVARLRRGLSAEDYAFALRRAPLITTRADPLAPDLMAEPPIDEQLVRSGVNYLGLALAGLDDGLLARLALRLPRSLGVLLEAPRGGVAAGAAWLVVRKVVREAEPEWSVLLS